MKRQIIASFILLLTGATAWADDTAKAAVGGGVGGAIGAAVGEELGDRNGAIIGGAVGGAIGAAIATDERDSKAAGAVVEVRPVVVEPNPPGKFCPPGQAKKGRC